MPVKYVKLLKTAPKLITYLANLQIELSVNMYLLTVETFFAKNNPSNFLFMCSAKCKLLFSVYSISWSLKFKRIRVMEENANSFRQYFSSFVLLKVCCWRDAVFHVGK